MVAAIRVVVDGAGRDGGAGDGVGGGETLRVAAFVESGNGGFSHVTLVAGDGGERGGSAEGIGVAAASRR